MTPGQRTRAFVEIATLMLFGIVLGIAFYWGTK